MFAQMSTRYSESKTESECLGEQWMNRYDNKY